MNKKSFVLDRESPWYIYGYTEKGRWLIEKLREDKCNVRGFIDRNANTFQGQTNDCVINADNLNIPNQSIIVISCQTINTQLTVAKELSRQGYNNLIYMAAGRDFNKKEASDIRQIYEKIFTGKKIEYGKNVYQYNSILTTGIEKRENTRIFNNVVTLEVPIELLYTKAVSKTELKECKAEMEQALRNTSNKPLIIYEDVNAFFKLALRGEGDAMEYFKHYMYWGGHDLTSLINDRRATLKIWLEELKNGMDYFWDAAAAVKWNEKGYFNVIDGVHRSLFLYYSGFNRIPVTMKYSDYQKYCNGKIRKEMGDLLKVRNIGNWEDYFYEYFQTGILASIFRYLDARAETKRGFFDLYSNTGYFACMAYKFGFYKVAGISTCSTLAQKSAELLYVSSMQCFCEEDIQGSIDNYNVFLLPDLCGSSIIKEIMEYKRKSAEVVLFLIQDCGQSNLYGFQTEVLGSYLSEGKIKNLLVLQ